MHSILTVRAQMLHIHMVHVSPSHHCTSPGLL